MKNSIEKEPARVGAREGSKDGCIPKLTTYIIH